MDYFKNISYTMCHIFLFLFLYFFVTHRFSKRKTQGICIASFLFLTISDILKLNLFAKSNLCYVVVTLLQIFVTQFTGIYISRTRDSRVIFMSLSASNYVIAGSVAASILHILTRNPLISLIGSFLVHLIILAFLYVRIRDICLKGYEREAGKNWWELCLIPIFFYCGFSFLAFFPHTLYDNPDNITGTIFFIITMFVSYVVVLRYLESETKRADIYWKNMLFESYIRGLENQYHLVEQAERNLKILRHDMRHYSNMIDSLVTQEEYDEIRKIAAHIKEVADENKVVNYCENIIINSILSLMMERAHSLSIDMRPDIIMPKNPPFNDYEFASVIANLLENALISVQDLKPSQKYVEVKIHCEQDHLLLQMKNAYEKEMLFDSVTGLPKSIKGKDHGLGMKSISAFSEKIGGNIGCFCENGIFHIMIFAKF